MNDVRDVNGASSGWKLLSLCNVLWLAQSTLAHNVSSDNAAYLSDLEGPAVGAFIYLGAKHMVTGVDHLLYLLGVVFFLSHFRDVLTLVSVFALGHSLTLIGGVWLDWQVSPSLIDAAIGLSVVYKAYENVGGFGSQWPISPIQAVFGFGLLHGLGLATKLQAVGLSENGLMTNLVSFNVGVELGQVFALGLILVVMSFWRSRQWNESVSLTVNGVLMVCGFLFAGAHVIDWWLV
ncbi:MAG: HupE/UreJ family protein [Pseudomonadota bacterium]